MLKRLWEFLIAPLLRRPTQFQVAALCFRKSGTGVEVLLVTSRETKRWILPKGWLKRGYDAAGTALEEAWEEAGVKSSGTPVRVGSYRYFKRLKGDVPVRTDVDVYAIEVDMQHADFPEVGQRTLQWMTPTEAAAKISEPELRVLLRDLPPQVAG